MSFWKWFITGGCKLGLSFAYRIHRQDWERVPAPGPLIIYGNHTAAIEVPIYYTQLQPRPVTGIGKAELWDRRFVAWVMKLWGVIPVRRGESDMDAMRKSIEAIKGGKIFGIAPEGTRSPTGALIKAHPGIVTMAMHADAPLLPIAHWGGETRARDARRLRRTDFFMRVGRPFRFDTHGENLTRELRQSMADEAMYQLSALLPEQYRGVYADFSKASERHLVFV